MLVVGADFETEDIDKHTKVKSITKDEHMRTYLKRIELISTAGCAYSIWRKRVAPLAHPLFVFLVCTGRVVGPAV